MATNVAVLVFVVVGVIVVIRFTKVFFISQPIVVELRIRIGDNIIHNCTVTDSQRKS